MKQRIAIIITILGVVAVLGLATMNAVIAAGSPSDCGPNPSWGCLKCVYHPTCDPTPPPPNDNKNSGLIEINEG